MAQASSTTAKVVSSGKTVSTDFRKASMAKNLGRQLFDPSKQLTLSPVQITGILRNLGFDIPPSVQVTADVAQIMISGGALINAVNTSQSVEGFITPSLATINAVANIAEMCGLIGENAPILQMVQFGTDAAMVYSSAGTDVLADIGLALDITKQVLNISDSPDYTEAYTRYAKTAANRGLNNLVQKRERPQITAAAKSFADYHAGKLSTFQMLGQVATESPDLFNNYFPDLKGFIPTTTLTLFYTATLQKSQQTGLFGLGSREYNIKQTSQMVIETLQKQSKGQLQYDFLERYVWDPARPYTDIDTAFNETNIHAHLKEFYRNNRWGIELKQTPLPRIRIFHLAVLSTFAPYFTKFLSPNFDILPILLGLSLTPHDLGYDLFSDLKTLEPAPPQAPFTLNGVDHFTVKQKSQMQDQSYEARLLRQWDQSGDIASLASNPKSAKIIREWGWTAQFPSNTPTDSQIYARNPAIYQDISNYWQTIALSEQVKKDPFFSSYNFHPGKNVVSEGTLPSSSDFTALHSQLQLTSVFRKMNRSAKENIASFYDIPVQKLKMAPPEPGKLAKVI